MNTVTTTSYSRTPTQGHVGAFGPTGASGPDEKGRRTAHAEHAAGTLASYMHENGIHTTDPNQLYRLANNTDGKTPQDVQHAASYMLGHPKAYQAICTHGDPSSSGATNINNFDQAAQGNIPMGDEGAQGAHGHGHRHHHHHHHQDSMSTEHASGTLASYMNSNGVSSLDPNKLYALSTNHDGDTPPEVQQAASHMLANPKDYQKLETHDVSGSDGVAGKSNFEDAAQGKLDFSGGSDPSADSTGTAGANNAGEIPNKLQARVPALQAATKSHPSDRSVGSTPELSTAPQRAALTPDQSQRTAEAYKKNLMKDFGLSEAQASGIVGNLWHESGGMNSGINQGGKIGAPSGNMADDNGNGYGIAQWGGTRKRALIDYAKQHDVDPSSAAASYGYLKKELSGPYSNVIEAVKRTNDVPGATAAFCNTFEKPSDPQMASRLNYAQQVAG